MGDTPFDDVRLRPEKPGEEAQVHALVEDAFGERLVADLVDRLRASPDWIDGLSFVAEHSGRLIGHILFSRSLLDAPRRLIDVLVLSPVSVASDAHGRGVGSALIRYGLDRVALRPEPLVFLERSPRYYRRFGFEPAGKLGFRRPSLRIPEPAFQVIRQVDLRGLDERHARLLARVLGPRLRWPSRRSGLTSAPIHATSDAAG